MARLAAEHKPKMIIAGGSAYPRRLDFAKFRAVADSVGALFLVDMAHISGMVAANVVPSPFAFADIVTTTSHKSLRGPRGALIFFRRGVRRTNPKTGVDEMYNLEGPINASVFPGHQGGPHNHTIAALAVALKQAQTPEFRAYQERVLANARALAASLKEHGLDVVSGGTDNHLMLVDLRPKNATGKRAEQALGRANITCNKNGIPFDPEKPFVTSGVRLGTPAGTTRGFGEAEFRLIGEYIVEVLDGLREANSDEGNAADLDHATKIELFK